MFCDLSGFSRMGAEAIARSERGAEALRAGINAVFARVVPIVSRRGGSILYYAGDAVAAQWPVTNEPDDDAAGSESWGAAIRRAAACGLAVQAEIATMPGDLAMRVGLSTGDLWVLDVAAAHEARHILPCGPALDAVAGMRLCADGVELTVEAAALARSCGLTVERGEDEKVGPVLRDVGDVAERPCLPVPDFDALPYLHAHQRAGLDLALPDWLAEFRQARILFARYPGFSFAQAGDLAEAETLLRTIASAVEESGGSLLQICCDDKGLVAIGVWGLATSAWEDAAARGVMAARALHEASLAAGQPVFIGLASGKVFAGLVGAEPYLQYVVVGDAINRAAAMSVKEAAPIVLDETVRAAVERRFVTERVAELHLKGHDEPAPVHAVRVERLRGLAHAGHMIGRDAEQARLDAIVGRMAAGERVVIVIEGEAGLGKSRLAAWLEGRSADRCRLLHVQADGLRRTIGYTPFAPLVRERLGLDERATAQACHATCIEVLGEEAAEVLPLLNPVLPVTLPETPLTGTLSGAGRAERTRVLVTDLLARLLRSPAHGQAMLLVVEDAHWLDSASWQLLDALTREIDTLSLCLVTRPLAPDDLPGEARRLVDEARTETIALARLSPEESGRLVAQTLDARESTPPLTELIHREAAGHPLFTAALALNLEGRGVVRNEGGYLHLRLGEAGLAQVEIPDGVAGAFQERIAALRAGEQLTVKTAAVLGRTFDTGTLAALHPVADPETVARELRRIAGSGLIERVERGSGTHVGTDPSEGAGTDGSVWRFHHAIIADAAYHSLVSEQARRLHAAAAARFEARAGASPDQTDLALMAHHYERAGDRTNALRTLAAAAAGARRAYANLEVVDFLTRALILANEEGPAVDGLTRGRWQHDIAYALRALGQYQRAEDFLKACITGLDRAPPETGGQTVRRLLSGYATFRLSSHRASQPEAVRAPVILAADATMMLSEIHYELNKIPFALAEILRGANLARRAGGDSATLAKLYIGLALISTSLPRALDGDALQTEALAIADRLDDPATECWVYMVSGNYEAGKAGWEAGERHFRRAYAVSERCGERKTWETTASTLANLKRLEGWFEEAKGWSDVTLATSRDRGIVQGVIWSHNGRARDLVSLSRWDELRGDVEALERLLHDPANALDANDNNQLVYHYTRGALALADGDEATALKGLDAALAIVARTKRPQVYMTQNVPFYSDIIWALWERGHRDAAMLDRQTLVAKTGARIGRQYRAGRPAAALAQGDGAWLRGNARKAEASWRTSIEAAETLSMSYNAAQALDRLTRTGVADERVARDWHLERLGIELPDVWRLSG